MSACNADLEGLLHPLGTKSNWKARSTRLEPVLMESCEPGGDGVAVEVEGDGAV